MHPNLIYFESFKFAKHVEKSERVRVRERERERERESHLLEKITNSTITRGEFEHTIELSIAWTYVKISSSTKKFSNSVFVY